MSETLFVGVAGATCSGKTTLEKGLQRHYGAQLDILPFDDMCYKYDELDEAHLEDWEQPEQYNFDRYVELLSDLKNGQPVRFCANSGQSYTEGITERRAEPRSIILSVGFLAFHDERARDLFDVKLFIDLPELVIEERRVARDSSYESVGPEGIRLYTRQYIIPAHRKNVQPQKAYADHVLDGQASKEERLALAVRFIEESRKA